MPLAASKQAVKKRHALHDALIDQYAGRLALTVTAGLICQRIHETSSKSHRVGGSGDGARGRLTESI